MRRHLCISLTFLDSRFHGKAHTGEPEWPPSPLRLFQAVLAGSRLGCRNVQWSTEKEAAFQWWERCAPPLIITPTARRESTPYTLFVPNNDADRKFDRQARLTGKTVWPHRLLDGDTVHYLWPISDGDSATVLSHAEWICREARHLVALGWGIDHVVGHGCVLGEEKVTALPGHRWRPHAGHRPGHVQSRVPRMGTLHDLEQCHVSFLERVVGNRYSPPSRPTTFSVISYLRQTILPPRPCVAFELPEGVAFRQVDTVKVAAMLRSLACRCARQDTHEFCFNDGAVDAEVYVAGHVNGTKATPPRFSYLPIPSIGHEHADGMIRRLVIAEPYGGDSTNAAWAQLRLRNQTLTDKEGNRRGTLLDLWRRSSQAMIERYVRHVNPARSWCTVTPVVLPGLDDGKHAKAEKLFLAALQDAGIPVDAIQELALRKAPYWSGSQHPAQYRMPDYLAAREYRTRQGKPVRYRLPAWHVRLLFRESIPGPLAIGAGRHCGLGLFAAAES